MMISVVAVVMVVTMETRNKRKFELYLKVRGLRTVRFCRKVMCACFEEFFKTVEWQLVNPGRDEWHQIGGVAGQDDDSCEVSGQEDDPTGRECWRLLLTWQNKKWELSCDFLVQVILISDSDTWFWYLITRIYIHSNVWPYFFLSSLLCGRCWYTFYWYTVVWAEESWNFTVGIVSSAGTVCSIK
jgi:hypothetical protein